MQKKGRKSRPLRFFTKQTPANWEFVDGGQIHGFFKKALDTGVLCIYFYNAFFSPYWQ